MKKVYGTALIILIVVGVLFVVTIYKQPTSDLMVDGSQTEELLVVPPQEVSTSVFIERIVLHNPGFLAVRSIENGRLAQIIEISPYLVAGTHENITIDLGAFNEASSELLVIAYNDTENDQVFNDLERPIFNADTSVLARYVKTGEAASSQLFTSTQESEPHVMGDMILIRYTNDGYIPAQLEVPAGTAVTFINESDGDMWVASDEHPGHTDLPTFDQFSPSDKTSTYTYMFDQIGEWYFHDHLEPAHGGLITVN